MLAVIDVSHQWHDRTDSSILRSRRKRKNRQKRIAGEIARAADPIHQTTAQHVGTVYVAKKIGFDRRVHRNQSKSANQLRVIANFLRPQNESLAKLFYRRIDVP